MLMLASSNFEDPDAKEWGMVSIRSSGHLKMGIGQSSVSSRYVFGYYRGLYNLFLFPDSLTEIS